MRSERCAVGFRRGRVTRSGRPVVSSGRYLDAGSQVPWGLSWWRERMKEGVSSGRPAADNNQAWTADRRLQDCSADAESRVQIADQAECPRSRQSRTVGEKYVCWWWERGVCGGIGGGGGGGGGEGGCKKRWFQGWKCRLILWARL